MKNVTLFDVLVVYTHGVATSAATENPDDQLPFSVASKRIHYNNAYAYFLETCAKKHLRAAFTTSIDRNYWIFQKKQWLKIKQPCRSQLIFDKFSPINEKQKERRQILFSKSKIRPFNSQKLFDLFYDKLATYKRLKQFTVPTVPVKNHSLAKVNEAIKALRLLIARHPHKNDFSDLIVVKDRFGAGGNNIFRVNRYNQSVRIFRIIQKHKKVSFALQPFVNFEKGYRYRNFSGYIDIRIIYLRGHFVQAYIRTAKEKDFRCNEHQGGSLIYITKRDIPAKVLRLSEKIVTTLREDKALFALDFVVTNNGNIYLMEGNNGPGIDWNLTLKKNERQAKRLIRLIVGELAKRATRLETKNITAPETLHDTTAAQEEILTQSVVL